ncbi:MAG: hemolysin family protein [Myxococcota bacterium]
MVLALILLNGVFSGAEIAILSIRRTRLQELLDGGSSSARWVAALRHDPERFLATVQVGITVVGATAAAFGGSSVAARLAPVLASIPTIGPHAEPWSLAIVVAGVSFLSLVLGELVPKSLALRAAEPYALVIARPLAWLSWAARPLVWVLTGSSNLVLRLFGDRTSFVEARLSPDELQQLVDEAASAGTVDPGAGEIASRALSFAALDAAAVMVPRSELVAVPRTATLDELAALTVSSGLSRILVYGADPEDLIGYVNVRDALARARTDPAYPLAEVVHPIPFVPTSMAAPSLLRELQRRRSQLAVVVDEQGTVRGLVTVEDLVEELVGDILNENERPEDWIVREEGGAFLVDASVPVHTLNREVGLSLPEGEAFKTLGGLVLDLAGRIPARGDRLDGDGYALEVVDATHRKITTVRILPTVPDPA